jgi:hypothetical protein
MSKATRGRCELPGAAQDAGEVALVALQPVGAVGRVVIAPPALVALLGQIAQMVPAAAAADLVAVRGLPRLDEVRPGEEDLRHDRGRRAADSLRAP